MHGRERERAILADLLSGARDGTAAAIVIRGEAGVGKSTLLDAVVGDATTAGMRILRSQGLESESPLAFAGLHQLLRPLLPNLDTLPAPQARALQVAFGEQEGPAVDPFLVALATLAMLTDAAETQPVLSVIDDAHWLDDASTAALLFAARRLQADAVVIAFTARDNDSRTFTADNVAELRLEGLDENAGRALLAEQLGAHVSNEVAGALLAQTGGNPLALVELPTELTHEQLSGAQPLPAQLHLTDRVQRVFLDRCRRLPQSVQTLLLVAAADDTGDLTAVQQAAGALGADTAALQQAVQARLLITDGDSLRVRHPLVRSAMYQAATGQERREAHRALAAALGNRQDPDRQAWHLAAATDGPDIEVAAALERAAERADRAGGYTAAAAAHERAAVLTADKPLRATRLYAAAKSAWAGGQASRAGALAEAAKAIADERLLRADIDRLRARIEINVGSPATAHHILVAAARAVVGDDPVRALEMRVAATLTHQYNDDVPQEMADVWPTDELLPNDPRTRCLRELLTTTNADAAHRWPLALQTLTRAIAAMAEIDDLDVVANVGNAALHIGDDDGHRRCYTRMLAGARDRTAVMFILYALARLPFTDLLGGRWGQVRDSSEEALALATAAGQKPLTATPLAWLTMLAALRGEERYDELRAQLDAAEQLHLGVLTNPIHDLSRWAAGIQAMHAGDAAGALHQLSQLRVTPITRMAALDRFDAAVRSDNRPLARQWVTELTDFAEQTGWGWAAAAVAYGQALLADPEDAPAQFDAALAHSARASRPYERARIHLAYGELLRRSQRRVDARQHLRAALTLFEELGAEPLAARAGQELRASGETARKRDPSTLTALTPMELQVVQLVTQGLSNKDVATQLWISPRTVAFHLRGSFAKLGVSSRGELTQLHLPDPRHNRETAAASQR